MHNFTKIGLAKVSVLTLSMLCSVLLSGQTSDLDEPQLKNGEPVTKIWVNTYGNIRISDKFFWIAQTHFRTQETAETPFAGQIAQIYNRHAINYFYSKKFNMSLGGVLRLNFNTDEQVYDKNMVPEWRIWHEYQFAVPFPRIMAYHRLRIEHRWTKGFNTDSEYIFRNRWRYMFALKIPINKHKLEPKTFYIGPEAELIMQNGKSVIDSPMEDLRLHTSFGYILTPRLTVATGFMYTYGQTLGDGAYYKQGYTLRFHVYFSPDFRKTKNKLPPIHLTD